MHVDTTATNIQGSGVSVTLKTEPDICPVCHNNVHPKLLSSTITAERNMVQSIFRCTRLKCQEVFIGTYTDTGQAANARKIYALSNLAPITAKKADFSQTIQELSPTFVEIYNQALSAESSNLTQLVGIGLRKAIEFLVKDFAINQNQEKEEEIKNSFLGKCINDYIDDQNVKACAKRATWLGNDETHYIRKWEQKDIRDLKLLVKLTVNWVENVLLTAQYIEDMTE